MFSILQVLRMTLAASVCLSPAFAESDWTQFRGPNGVGVNETEKLPAEFGPAKNLVWKRPLPPGHSSPVLAGDRVFLTAFEWQVSCQAGGIH